MLVKLERRVFDELNNEELMKQCMEPIIVKTKAKSPAIKLEVYKNCSKGQRALFMFSILYEHGKTIQEFYWFSKYYMVDLNGWEEMKQQAIFLNDKDLISSYEQIEKIHKEKNQLADGTWREVSTQDLDEDSALYEAVNSVHKQYISAAQKSIELICIYIRENPTEFVQFN